MPSSLIPALKRLALIDHLTVRQALLLLALAEAPVEQRTVSAQAQAMGIPQQSVSRAAAALFRLGLIYRQRHGSNARAVLLTVSDDGLRLLAEVGRDLDH